MNIYRNLNELTEYIEDNLEQEINYEKLSKFLGVDVYTMNKIFNIIVGLPLSEYIRKRRLSKAGYDLQSSKCKIIDVAFKYQYQNATSFSRAFTKFHGFKPSLVNKKNKLKNFPRILFDENINVVTEFEYEIVNLKQLELYGTFIKTDNKKISEDAPNFFHQTEEKYFTSYGQIPYAMVTYDAKRLNCQKYYCLYKEKIANFEKINIPSSKWLKFRIPSQNAQDIQKMSHRFYRQFLLSCQYNLKELPELEYYHDNVTDFLVAIY